MSPTGTPVATKKAPAKKTAAKQSTKGAKAKKYDGPSRQERVEEVHEMLMGHLETMVSGEDWQAFLSLASKFHNYSANNCMLISIQCPTATRVASFNKWKELGRYVKKGEKAISILAPCGFKYEDADGDERFMLRGFKPVGVFDISQTEGDDLDEREITTLLEGEAPAGMWDAISALIEAGGYTISFGDTRPANGVTYLDAKKVVISSTLSPAAAVKTLVHELTHTLQSEQHRKGLSRNILEIESESVAYVICNYFGLASAPYSIGYVAGWSGGKLDVVRTTADWVVKTAHTILASVIPEETPVGVAAEV
jgi:hypothetical protein